MFNIIVSLVVIFLSLLGVSEIIYYFGTLILKPRVKPKKTLIIYLDKDCAEQQILSELFNMRWFGERFSKKIIFITDALEQTDAYRLEKEYSGLATEFRSGVFNE